MPNFEFRETLQRYARLRRLAHGLAQHLADPGEAAAIQLTDIDARALDVWARTWAGAHPLGYGGWDWAALVARVCSRPSAFQVAVWSGDNLCGLAVGRISKRRASGRRHTVSLHYLEASPNRDHPLRGRIAPLVITAAEAYGRELGAWRIRLVDPLPGVFRLYERLGFRIARPITTPLYFEKRIEGPWTTPLPSTPS